MAIFRVQNLDLNDPDISWTVFQQCYRAANNVTPFVGVSLAVQSLNELQLIPRKEDLKISVFGWRKGNLNDFEKRDELKEAEEVWLANGKEIQISLTQQHEKPFYDWNECPSSHYRVTISKTCRQAEKQVGDILKRQIMLVVNGLQVDLPENKLRETISSSDSETKVMISASFLEKECAMLLFYNFARMLECDEVPYAVHFAQTLSFFSKSSLFSEYSTKDFPIQIQPPGIRKSFTIDPYFQFIPNFKLDDAETLLRGYQANKHATLAIGREYLSWQSEVGSMPRTQGNFIRLWHDKRGVQISLGVEQFSDSDPPVKSYVSLLKEKIRGLGGDLKSSRY